MANLVLGTVAMQAPAGSKATSYAGSSRHLRSKAHGQLNSRRAVQAAFWGRKKEAAKTEAAPQAAGESRG